MTSYFHEEESSLCCSKNSRATRSTPRIFMCVYVYRPKGRGTFVEVATWGWLQRDNTTLCPPEVVKIPETRLSTSQSIFLPSFSCQLAESKFTRSYARVYVSLLRLRSGRWDRSFHLLVRYKEGRKSAESAVNLRAIEGGTSRRRYERIAIRRNDFGDAINAIRKGSWKREGNSSCIFSK